ITDVDDKINARAAQEGVSIRELTERTARQVHEDVAARGELTADDVNPPGTNARRFIEPRATVQIEQMTALIERLHEQSAGYGAGGRVLYDVSAKADYGKLSRRSLEEMVAGSRVEVAPYKRGAMDFVLWKPSPPELPGWDSPWGRGRPGWHIECSAMSAAYLGEVFDIHGGGLDLIFPHHENEIAQSRCAHGTSAMANYWLHNGFLQVEGQKMSKSLGNFFTIHELLETETFGGRKWPGEVLRLAMLMTHYREPIDFAVRKLEEAENTLRKWKRAADLATAPAAVPDEMIEALCDDLATYPAFQFLSQLAGEATEGNAAAASLKAALAFLGFDVSAAEVDETLVEKRITERLAFIREKNWAEADRIRDELLAQGIQLKDGKDPATG